MQYNLLEILGMMSMEAASQPKLTVDEFFEAISGADERYEFINGVAYAIDGAKEGHNVICSNVLVAIAPAGKKSGCRTTSSDTAVQTGPDHKILWIAESPCRVPRCHAGTPWTMGAGMLYHGHEHRHPYPYVAQRSLCRP